MGLKGALYCPYCREWNEDEERYVQHIAFKMNWRPPEGIDPKMRKFRCARCKAEFYQILKDKEVEVSGNDKAYNPDTC